MKLVMIDATVGNDYSFCLCSSLREAGVEVSLVVTEDRTINPAIPLSFALKKWSPSKNGVSGKGKKTLRYVRYLGKLLRLLVRQNSGIAHFQFFRREGVESLFYVLLRLVRVKVVYTAHDIFPLEGTRRDFFIRYLVYKASRRIFVHSEYNRHLLMEHFNIKPGKIKIIPHGNFDHYLPERHLPQEEARRRLQLQADDHVLLFFGNIREYKGLDLLLDAFAVAARKNSRLKLVIAGQLYDDALRQRYADQIAALPARDRILYHARFIPSEKVAEYFRAADVAVLPYHNIYHSGVLHLAYSFGKPVIATRVGDFPETIVHGRSGYLLEKHDHECLAQAILKIFSDNRNLAAMGAFARELSETKYSWASIAQQAKQEYAVLLQGR